MKIYTVMDKIRNNNGKITHYVLRTEQGRDLHVEADVLKSHLQKNMCKLTNYKLTSDNRLVQSMKGE